MKNIVVISLIALTLISFAIWQAHTQSVYKGTLFFPGAKVYIIVPGNADQEKIVLLSPTIEGYTAVTKLSERSKTDPEATYAGIQALQDRGYFGVTVGTVGKVIAVDHEQDYILVRITQGYATRDIDKVGKEAWVPRVMVSRKNPADLPVFNLGDFRN